MKLLENSVEPPKRNLLHFIRTNRGKSFERYTPINQFVNQGKESGLWHYGYVMNGPIAPVTNIKGMNDDRKMENFASSDYLGLTQHPSVHQAAHDCIQQYGIHASASPVLTGNTPVGKALEEKLSNIFRKDAALLFTTGWAANYGVIVGLASREGLDHFFIDALAHNCLRTAVEHIKGHGLQNFRHNDLDDLEEKLKKCRATDTENGIFIVIDSLYSMKSSSPDLPRVLRLAEEYEAFVILDVAHDFAAVGNGLGTLEGIDLGNTDRLIISGCFSKSLATNGGFVVGHRSIYHQIMLYSPTYFFSTGIDPIPCAIAKSALEVAFSKEGDLLRGELASLSEYAKLKFTEQGFEVLGNVRSAIVPVLIGNENVARFATRFLHDHGILVNRAEFPAVARGEAILRFSLMATHEKGQIDRAAELLQPAVEYAQKSCGLSLREMSLCA